MTTSPRITTTHEDRAGEHLVHRLAHALYGLIVLTATVGELRVHETEPETAAAIILSGALVLVVAHSYSQVVATAALTDDTMQWRQIEPILVDQLALAIPAAIATGVMALAIGDVISLDAAYATVLVGALLGLFATGVGIGRHKKRGPALTLAMAVGGTLVGIAVIAIEVAVGH